MLKEQIVVGQAYVNVDASIIREVVEEIDANCVSFNAFDLTTGKLIPTRHRICHKGQMARWAHREASGSERALVHPYEPSARFNEAPGPEQGGVWIEDARAALDGAPGLNTFPRAK
jgi:hypothetical protein